MKCRKTLTFFPIAIAIAVACGCSEGRDLSSDQLSTVVETAAGDLRDCNEASLRKLKAGRGPLEAEATLHVDASGKVDAIDLKIPADPELASCVSGVLEALSFPQAEVETHAALPLVFAADEAE